MRKKLFSMLALLCLTAAGAWAQTTPSVKELNVPESWNGDETTFSAADLPADFKDCSSLTEDEAKALLNSVPTGNVVIFYGAGASSNSIKFVQHYGDNVDVADNPVLHETVFSIKNDCKFYYTAEQTIDVTPVTGQTNQWTLAMPAGNVVLHVEYEPWKVTLLTNNDQWGTVEAVTGGGVMELTMPDAWSGDETAFSAADMPGFAEVTDEVAKTIPAPSSEGGAWLIYGLKGNQFKVFTFQNGVRDGDEPSTLSVTRNVFYTALLNSGYKICYTTGSDVTANADGTYSVAAGKSITLKATPKDGYRLAGWYKVEGNDVTEITDGTDAEQGTLTLTPEADMTIRAEFAELTYTVTLNDVTYGSNAHVTATVAGSDATITADGKIEGVKKGQTVTLNAQQGYKFRKVEAKEGGSGPRLISEATTEDYGMVVCAAGHLHDAKTAVPDGCTAVGILGKVTDTGHGLILALQNAASQTWNTINGWTSVTTYASTTLKQLPNDAARGSLTSYTTLGSTAVSNWAVAQKGDYDAIFTNLGSTQGDEDGTTYDANVNAFITTGVGGTAISGNCWSASESDFNYAWYFDSDCWNYYGKADSHSVRPVLGF